MTQSAARITGVGAVTPLGLDAWSSAAAVRAGACAFREHAYLVDTAGEPVRIAAVRRLPAEIAGVERYAKLLFAAIDEALRPSPEPRAFALVVGVPEPRPGLPPDLGPALEARARRRYGRRIASVRFVAGGHAAALLGAAEALRDLAAGAVPAGVVAGVESYLDAETLEWVEQCDQLHGGGPLNNAWGFVPGEAAGALLLQPAGTPGPSLAELVAVGTGVEAMRIKTDTVCVGAGLTTAYREALAALAPGEVVDDVYCDLNGEAYRADEYGFTVLRTRERFRAATDFVAPADVWGDVGAAGAPLHVLLAIAAARRGHANGPLSLVSASAEGGGRGAAIVRAPVAARE